MSVCEELEGRPFLFTFMSPSSQVEKVGAVCISKGTPL